MFTKKEETSGLWSNAAFCFFAGAMIGAAVTLLYSPQSGEETRAQLMDKTSDLKHKLTDATAHMAEKVSDMGGQASRKLQEWKGMARDAAHEVGQGLEKV